eukprot:2961687-Amphidinium_carterae.2
MGQQSIVRGEWRVTPGVSLDWPVAVMFKACSKGVTYCFKAEEHGFHFRVQPKKPGQPSHILE